MEFKTLKKIAYLFIASALFHSSQSNARVANLHASDHSGSANCIDISADQIEFFNPTTGKYGDPVRSPAPIVNKCRPSTPSAYTTQHVYLMQDAAGSIDVAFSTNAPKVGPVLPAGFVAYAYAYSVRSDSNGGMATPIKVAGDFVRFINPGMRTLCGIYPAAPFGPVCSTSLTNHAVWDIVPDGMPSMTVFFDPEVGGSPPAQYGSVALAVIGTGLIGMYPTQRQAVAAPIQLDFTLDASVSFNYQWLGPTDVNGMYLGIWVNGYRLPTGF